MNADGSVFRNRAEQVVAHLRTRLEEGHWETRLPPERDLAQQLGVSRWTLRAAIKELQNEGMIGQRSQAGTEIVQVEKAGTHRISVGLVVSGKADLSNRRIYFMLEQMRHHLQVQGGDLEVHKTVYLYNGTVSAHFKRLMRSVRHDCWVLISPPESMQVWCAQERLPVMVSGISAEATGLPSSSVDFRALCHHAAGAMISRGHRRLAMVLAGPEKSEDGLSRLGFEEGVREWGKGEVAVRYEAHDQSYQGIRRLVDRLLEMEKRPTAWLVCRQGSFTRLFTYLLHRQVRIPGELSVLCRDSDDYFDDMIPLPSCYRVERAQLVHQAARLALRVALGQAQPGEKARLMPELVQGETLAAL